MHAGKIDADFIDGEIAPRAAVQRQWSAWKTRFVIGFFYSSTFWHGRSLARNLPRPDRVEAHGNLAAALKKQGKRGARSYPGALAASGEARRLLARAHSCPLPFSFMPASVSSDLLGKVQTLWS